MDATTIHSALKISPVTNEELRVFEQQKGKKAPDLSTCRVFVVEEASMVDMDLFRIIRRSIQVTLLFWDWVIKIRSVR